MIKEHAHRMKQKHSSKHTGQTKPDGSDSHASKHDATHPPSRTRQTKSHKQVFDIVPPGKAPASPTSRPVIPPPKPVPDDQFVPGAPRLASDPMERRDLLDGKHKKALAPLNTSVVSAESREASQPAENVPTATTAPTLPQQAETAPAHKEQKTAQGAQSIAAVPSPPSAGTPNPPDSAALYEEERTAGHLALEQVVEADPAISDAAAPSPAKTQAATQAEPAAQSSQPLPPAPEKSTEQNAMSHPTTIDELLADTSPPALGHETAPPSSTIVSHHRSKSSLRLPILIFISILVLAAIALNFLLDAEMITTTLEIPHTDFL